MRRIRRFDENKSYPLLRLSIVDDPVNKIGGLFVYIVDLFQDGTTVSETQRQRMELIVHPFSMYCTTYYFYPCDLYGKEYLRRTNQKYGAIHILNNLGV